MLPTRGRSPGVEKTSVSNEGLLMKHQGTWGDKEYKGFEMVGGRTFCFSKGRSCLPLVYRTCRVFKAHEPNGAFGGLLTIWHHLILVGTILNVSFRLISVCFSGLGLHNYCVMNVYGPNVVGDKVGFFSRPFCGLFDY
ncbi:hypothetical protein AMTRI_Chr06g194480 [Amborella trichopoda]